MAESNSPSDRKDAFLRWEYEVFLLFALTAAVICGLRPNRPEFGGVMDGILVFSGLSAIVAPIVMALRRLR